MSSNPNQIKWYVGLALKDHRESPYCRVVQETKMARRGSLGDLMQRGILKSAWGDNDTPDSVGLSGREDKSIYRNTPEGRAHEQAEQERRRLIQEEANRAHERRMADLRLKEEMRRLKTEQELEEVPGYGSF